VDEIYSYAKGFAELKPDGTFVSWNNLLGSFVRTIDSSNILAVETAGVYYGWAFLGDRRSLPSFFRPGGIVSVRAVESAFSFGLRYSAMNGD